MSKQQHEAIVAGELLMGFQIELDNKTTNGGAREQTAALRHSLFEP